MKHIVFALPLVASFLFVASRAHGEISTSIAAAGVSTEAAEAAPVGVLSAAEMSAALKTDLREAGRKEKLSAVPEPTALVYGGVLCGGILLWGLRQRRKREAGLA